MDEGQSFNFMKHFNNRPTSLKVELLSIPETNSARNSYVQHDVSIGEHLGFRNLSYSVKEGLFKRSELIVYIMLVLIIRSFVLENKQVLYEVNGGFLAGEVTAIMGPSGAGKSTLMNILAGYTTHGISGELLVDSKIRNENLFRKQSCYIMQDDNLQPLLTVKEAMGVAACLKLGSDVTKEERQTRIDEILKALGLWQCRLIKTKSLSGGQRKRLAIALELLKNPQIMFFDEPTSGLDSVSTKQCILLLKQLAQEGRTIIITIHQPSASICEMLDHLYVLAEGKCIYQGSVKGVVPYLQESNLFCPAYHNPADYLIEVAAGEHGEYVDLLVSRMGNGTNHDWRKMQIGDESGMQSIEAIDKMMRNGLVTPVRSPTSPGFHWALSVVIDWWHSNVICCNLNFDELCQSATDPANGVIFGPFFLLPFTIFSGFFVQLYDVHPYMRWIFHISYIKYGFEGLMLAIFGYDREKMPCNADYCNYHYPKIFLEDVDMADAVYSYSVIFLLGLIVFLRVLAFIALYLRIQLRR
ncbi:abc transporter g family member 28 [Holotrichia oblita]|uniref:Abc transporter g family member 28 n=1 Tax=Holotrichia oblita TaxID=644536 RepID=A0ACB9TA56_HOLOL|nr:abc transporter g family member 28 [Holotrichia oblita]